MIACNEYCTSLRFGLNDYDHYSQMALRWGWKNENQNENDRTALNLSPSEKVFRGWPTRCFTGRRHFGAERAQLATITMKNLDFLSFKNGLRKLGPYRFALSRTFLTIQDDGKPNFVRCEIKLQINGANDLRLLMLQLLWTVCLVTLASTLMAERLRCQGCLQYSVYSIRHGWGNNS